MNVLHHRKNKVLGQTQNAFSASSLRCLVERTLGSNPAIPWRLVDCRGLRLLSCRKRFKLENYYWFYRINTFLARYATSLAPEVNLIYRKEKLPSAAPQQRPR